MAKRRFFSVQSSMKRKLREKRGQGVLEQYKPWLVIQDVPSKGVVSRIKGWKTNRIHHMLSETLETAYFYTAEWDEDVLDIREQYPLLPLEKTLFIASKLGIQHPVHPKTKEPIVMTADFMLTLRKDDEVYFKAITIKSIEELTKREIEKFEIARRFFADDNIPLTLVTDKEINKELAANVKWVHKARDLRDYRVITSDLLDRVAPILTKEVLKEIEPLSRITASVDKKLGLPWGTSLSIAKHLIALRYWNIDMTEKIQPEVNPLKIRSDIKCKSCLLTV
jgi:hypothetical protein